MSNKRGKQKMSRAIREMKKARNVADKTRLASQEAYLASQDAKSYLNACMGRLNGKDWRELVDTIEDIDTRKRCACLIWFDWFGCRSANEAWDNLDDYKSGWDNIEVSVNKSNMRKALLKVGYSNQKAAFRLEGYTA